MGTAKQELDAIVASANWDWPESINLKDAIAQLVKQLNHFVDVVIPENWKGDAAGEATKIIVAMRDQWVALQKEAAEAHHHVAIANQALTRARNAANHVPSPVVSPRIRAAINAALNDGHTDVIIDGYAYVADGALSVFERFFGNREEQAAQEVLRTLQGELHGPEAQMHDVYERMRAAQGVDITPEELREAFGSDIFDDDSGSWQNGGGGGGYNYGGGSYPPPTSGNGPTPPDYGNPQPPLPHDPRIGGPYVPDPYTPGDPYPPYVPRDRDDYISIDDGSTGWQSRGLGAGVMGAAGLGGALAARSSLANSGSTTAANAAGSGQGGLLGSGAGGAGGPGGVGAGGLGAGGRSGGQMGMMGGQGGRGGAGSDKDKKPSLNGYMAPKLEDDEDEFIPLPDSARAGGRDTDQGGE